MVGDVEVLMLANNQWPALEIASHSIKVSRTGKKSFLETILHKSVQLLEVEASTD